MDLLQSRNSCFIGLGLAFGSLPGNRKRCAVRSAWRHICFEAEEVWGVVEVVEVEMAEVVEEEEEGELEEAEEEANDTAPCAYGGQGGSQGGGVGGGGQGSGPNSAENC